MMKHNRDKNTQERIYTQETRETYNKRTVSGVNIYAGGENREQNKQRHIIWEEKQNIHKQK